MFRRTCACASAGKRRARSDSHRRLSRHTAPRPAPTTQHLSPQPFSLSAPRYLCPLISHSARSTPLCRNVPPKLPSLPCRPTRRNRPSCGCRGLTQIHDTARLRRAICRPFLDRCFYQPGRLGGQSIRLPGSLCRFSCKPLRPIQSSSYISPPPALLSACPPSSLLPPAPRESHCAPWETLMESPSPLF